MMVSILFLLYTSAIYQLIVPVLGGGHGEGGRGGGGRWHGGRDIFYSGRRWRMGRSGIKLIPFTDPDLIVLSNELELWMSQPEDDVTSTIPPRLGQVLTALADDGSTCDSNHFYSSCHHHNNNKNYNRMTSHNNNNNENYNVNEKKNHWKRQTQILNNNNNDNNNNNNNNNNNAAIIALIDRSFEGEAICSACSLLAKLLVGYLRFGAPVDFMAEILVKICYIIAYRSMPVCRGIIDQDKDRLAYIVRNTNVNGEEICAMLLGDRGCGRFDKPVWNVKLPSPSQKRVHNHHEQYRSLSMHDAEQQDYVSDENQTRSIMTHSFSSSPYYNITTNTTTTPIVVATELASARRLYNRKKKKKALKVLHLTDAHYDPDYVAGSNAACEAPLCCNRDSGTPSSVEQRAGRWGDYRNCDSPKWLLHNMFEHIVSNHPDIDYVMCTGDLVPHHIWKISKKENLAVVREMADLIQDFFPNIPIYGSVGNHESFPRDSFPPPEIEEVWSNFGTQWLYDSLSDHWARMMGQPSPPSARFGGFYSVLVRPGFRIISINTNYCYRLNWWVLYKNVDPGLMISWLVGELTRSEQRGEFVHIIGHIPPLYIDCYDQWGHQFDRVVSRFSYIIRGQFYGHSHMDDIRIHYDISNISRPVGIEYITPNNGPFSNVNPSYRIFYIDGDHEDTTRDVLDYETWVMNLTHANAFNAPYWYKLYRAKADLQLPSLNPRQWDRFVHRMGQKPRLAQKFHRYQVQDSDIELAKGCDAACIKKTVCNIIDGNRLRPSKCGMLT